MSLADAKCSKLQCASLQVAGATAIAGTVSAPEVDAAILKTSSLGMSAGGAAPVAGRAVLAAGTTGPIATTAAAAQSIVIAFPEGTGANDGFLHYTVVDGVSITITSSDALDARNVNWMIVSPL